MYSKDIARKKSFTVSKGGLLVNGTISAVVVDEGGELLVYPGGEASNCEINQGGVFMLAGKASDTLLACYHATISVVKTLTLLLRMDSIYRLGTVAFSSTVPVRRKTCP